MENLVKKDFWQGRRVFITGHTGFKGSWLALWLDELGAKVTGYALPPSSTPNLFHEARIETTLCSVIGDIRDAEHLAAEIFKARPQTIFHLAAQPLVGEGYRDPVSTYSTNVMGTINLLEAVRHCPDVESLVIVTTDKCYENRETLHDYCESDPLGGRDPYSSSKACAEIIAAAYRQSFFIGSEQTRLATVRAGNVIGGGDWAENRLMPDLLRALTNNTIAKLRNPNAIRPWQHVLEPLKGYLLVAEKLAKSPLMARAWNFGPELEDCVSSATVAELTCSYWSPHAHWESEAANFPHEATLLRLNSNAAKQNLKWRPAWPLNDAIKNTVSWHRAWLSGDDMQAFSRNQINQYTKSVSNEP